MDSLTASRPNHYQLLGLTPDATDEEIRRAYAREISPMRPRAFGGLARLSVAHETLRDPARRRAYDESIGIVREPAPPPPLHGWQYSGPVRISRPGQMPAEPAAAPVAEAPPPPAPAMAERRAAAPPPRQAPKHDWAPAGPAPLQQRILPMEDDESSEWKLPAIVAGGLFVTVGIAGVLAGLWASRDVQSKVPEEVAITAPAEAHAGTLPPATEPTAEAPAQPQAKTVPPKHSTRTQHRPPSPRPSLAQGQRAEDVPEIPTEQVAALAAQSADSAAAMPLSDAVVARTIGRIGYSCGAVTSTSAVEGSPGVFKVTCSSGEAYKAAPVNGRYRFRKWGG